MIQTSRHMDESAVPAQETSMPTSPEALLAHLSALGIAYDLYHHEAVFTVAQSTALDAKIPGTPCRNLFLRDKKKKNFLVVLQHKTQIDIKKLPSVIGSDRLSFGSADRLWDYLGVRPGSVCPYALINDRHGDVTVILDHSMMATQKVNYHPLLNTMTISVTPKDLIRFIESCGHTPHIVDLSPAAPDGFADSIQKQEPVEE